MSSRWESEPRVQCLIEDIEAMALAIHRGSWEPDDLQAFRLTVAAADLAGKAAGYLVEPQADTNG